MTIPFEGLLAPIAGELDLEEALDTWRWLVPRRVRLLVLTAFGDPFLIAESGAVLFMDTIEGTISEVASSVEEWEQKVEEAELRERWFMPEFLLQLRESGAYLSQGECYHATHPIILNGKFSVENWLPTHWRVHFHALGQIHDQVKDLPEGKVITKYEYEEL